MAIEPLVNQTQARVPAPALVKVAEREAAGSNAPTFLKSGAPNSHEVKTGAQPVEPTPLEKAQKGEKEREEALNRLRQFATSTNREMVITVDKDSGQFVVKVLDAKTKELVRQIPSEDLLRVARQLDSNDKGGLLEATA